MSMTGDRIEVLELPVGEKKIIDEDSRVKEFFDENGNYMFTFF